MDEHWLDCNFFLNVVFLSERRDFTSSLCDVSVTGSRSEEGWPLKYDKGGGDVT